MCSPHVTCSPQFMRPRAYHLARVHHMSRVHLNSCVLVLITCHVFTKYHVSSLTPLVTCSPNITCPRVHHLSRVHHMSRVLQLEVRQLQGLCRKHGAEESSIQACCPPTGTVHMILLVCIFFRRKSVSILSKRRDITYYLLKNV